MIRPSAYFLTFAPQHTRWRRYTSSSKSFLSSLGLVFSLSLGSSLIGYGHNSALAQVGLSPLIIETHAKQGQARGYVTVNNTTSEAFRARVYTQPFSYTNRGLETLPTSSTDLSPYLQFSPRELIVPPGISRRIRFFVVFPPNLQDGEYRAVLFTENLQATDTKDNNGFNISLISRIGVPIYVRKGNLTSTLVAEKADIAPQHDQILLTLNNTGQSTVRPMTEWSIKQGNTLIRSGKSSTVTVVAGTRRTIVLDNKAGAPQANSTSESVDAVSSTSLALTPSSQTIPPGTYDLVGKLMWQHNNRTQNQPFTFNVTIPALPNQP